MRKIGIIGIGHVGSTTAYTLIQRQIADTLVLYDKNSKLVEAEVNDLLQGQIGNESTVEIIGNDLNQLGSCDLLIFSAGDIQILQGDTDRFDELDFTKKAVAEWAPKIKKSGFNGLLLSISNPCDVIVRFLQELTGLPHHQVIGTGTSLDTVRMQQAVGSAFNTHPNNVKGYVLGEHGETQFIAWSTVMIGNELLSDKLTDAELAELEDEARAGGWRIFFGKVYTCYGIANQAAKIVKALLTDAKMIMPVSVYSEKEGIYIGQPAQLGLSGVLQIYPLMLSVNERKQWNNSVVRIKEMYNAI